MGSSTTATMIELPMFVLVRAVTYAALFIGFVLVYLPGRFLSWSGVVAPATTGAPQVGGMIMVTIGTAIALWGVFFLITHLFVVLYEEPTLRRTFGDDYEAYFRRVRRWIPGEPRLRVES